MNFWVRNLIFAAILSGIAYALLVNQEALMSLGDDLIDDSEQVTSAQSAGAQTGKDANKEVIDPPQRSKKKLSKNAAAEGLSRFYANLHGTDEGDGPRIRDNVVFLPEPKGSLEKLLTAKGMVTRPLKSNWRGIKESRPFRTGGTLLQKLTEYAEKEGLDIVWRLNKDFIIKDPFRINKEILQTSYQVGKAVEGHFPDGMKIFFCYKQRSIVFIEGDNDYLTDECRLLTSKAPPQNRRRN